jgi:AcrR family transcriptional regulator
VEKKRAGKTSRRAEILAATEKLIRSRGLSGVTTREIAEAAGCSEGALYVHFKGRVDLLLAVLEESLPDMLKPLDSLQQAVGRATPQRNLEAALRGVFSFHRRVTPMLASLFAEPELLTAYRKSLTRAGKGPHRATGRLAGYILAEQSLGRIDPAVDAKVAATLLMSASFFRAFAERFFGQSKGAPTTDFFRKVVSAAVPAP